jgi:hypothetical protein
MGNRSVEVIMFDLGGSLLQSWRPKHVLAENDVKMVRSLTPIVHLVCVRILACHIISTLRIYS